MGKLSLKKKKSETHPDSKPPRQHCPDKIICFLDFWASILFHSSTFKDKKYIGLTFKVTFSFRLI